MHDFDRTTGGLITSIAEPEWVGNELSVLYSLFWESNKGWFFFRASVNLFILCFDRDGCLVSKVRLVEVFPAEFLLGDTRLHEDILTFRVPEHTAFIAIEFDYSGVTSNRIPVPPRHPIRLAKQPGHDQDGLAATAVFPVVFAESLAASKQEMGAETRRPIPGL